MPGPQTIGDMLKARTGQMPPMPQQMPSSPLEALQAQKPAKANIWGIIGDAMSAFAGNQPLYLRSMLAEQSAERERQARAQEAGMNREADYTDFIRKEEWKRDHPSNDTANDYAFWESKLSPEDFQTWRANKVDPPQYRQGPDGQFYRVSPPPTRPVGKLTPLGGSNVPSGSPLQPSRQPTAQPVAQGGADAFDRLVELYGPREGTARYLKLIGAE